MGAVVFFSIVTALVAFGATRYPTTLLALGGGLAIAVPLGLLALRLTKFETSADGNFYTPNTTIGLVVTLLFVGRIVYRIVTLVGTPRTEGMPPSMFQSPLTLLVFGVTAGYYITYYLGIYLRGRKETSVSVTP